MTPWHQNKVETKNLLELIHKGHRKLAGLPQTSAEAQDLKQRIDSVLSILVLNLRKEVISINPNQLACVAGLQERVISSNIHT